MCWMLEGPNPALCVAEAPTRTCTVPFALLSVHEDFVSLTLITSVPVGGFELKLTQVLLQPVTLSQKSAAVRRHSEKAFFATTAPMRRMAGPRSQHYRGRPQVASRWRHRHSAWAPPSTLTGTAFSEKQWNMHFLRVDCLPVSAKKIEGWTITA